MRVEDIQKEAREVAAEISKEDAKGIKERPPIYNRYFRLVISVLLVILMGSFILVDPNIREVIAGFFESSSVDGNKFTFEDKTIVFEDDTYEALVYLFKENQKAEFKACLTGTRKINDYFVKKIFLPKIYSQNVYRVVSGSCPDNTIISLHSHPHQRCIASEQDFKSFEQLKSRIPGALMAVMCTEGRISFYS